jgi:hypothetical protein
MDLAGTLAHCDRTTNAGPIAKINDYTICDFAHAQYCVARANSGWSRRQSN